MSVHEAAPSLTARRDLYLYIGGNTLGWAGAWVQRTVIGWLSWQLTHAVAWVGIVSLLQYVPLIVLGPMFGVWLDRCDRKRYAMLIQCILTGLALVLCGVQQVGVLNLPVLLVLALLLGCANSAYQPVRLALVHDVVSSDQVTRAIALNATFFSVMRLVGPALAGVLITFWGVGWTFLLCALAYAGSASALQVLRARPRLLAPASAGFATQLLEGIRYACNTDAMRHLMVLTFLNSTLARSALELLPAVNGEWLDDSSATLALLMSSAGAGAILAGALLARVPNRRVEALCAWACLLSALATLLFSQANSLLFCVIATALLGGLSTLASIALQAAVQHKVESDYRGRIIALWGVVNVAGPALGSALIGVLAHHLGLANVIMSSGLLCLIVCAWLRSSST